MKNFYTVREGKILINLHVLPNAKKTEILGIYNNKLKIKISSPAIEGKANKEVIKFFSKYFKISKSSIKIIKGEKSKEKIIEINDKNEEIIKKIKEVENANL